MAQEQSLAGPEPEDSESADLIESGELGAGEVRQENFEDSTTIADRRNKRQPIDHAGNEVENGPEIDPDDPNLSEIMTEAGAQEDRGIFGMRDEDEMVLGDPEEEEEE